MPVGNLSLRFLRRLPRSKAYIRAQNWPEGRRTMPTVNKSVLRSQVYRSLICLKQGLLMAKNGASYRNVFDFVRRGVHFAGPLGTQHLLAIAALCGVIPVCFARDALINQGTRTQSRVTEFYNIPASRADAIIAGVGRRLNFTTGFLENATCEFLRSVANDGRILWWDSVYPSQKIYFIVRDRIYVITHGSGTILAEELDIEDVDEGDFLWTMELNEQDKSYSVTILPMAANQQDSE